MGRAFEFRKERKLKRWGNMAVTFTKIGREIAIAVKQGGPDPANNPRLRAAIQNAKHENMPKDRVEAAIKRASSKDEKDLEEVVYEGYAPHGVPVVVECATDNPTRTVANVRMYFNRAGGSLGKTGSLDFMFERKAVFEIEAGDLDPEELELELIDFGAEKVTKEEEHIVVHTDYTDFGRMQKALEDKGVKVVKSKLERIPTTTVELSDEQADEVLKMIEKMEDDEDIQSVYHNLA